ncbi:fatty acid efflux pump transcriptional regulator FarR [Staphylococcus aureus]|uniref:fatty acid efflux pump transcriptional regulator FarR n=1 Tax=Staphylococcus aureus TaxID=1280 RepID=UPI0018EBAC1C|nr:fatty acid efflux pump transcriptional regulator FarR [Staphylococcus aureus]MBJ6163919.1 fatty acid efflux pump transcriptional regulator FarR [Staphylococcus aureus]MBJ6179755.1 fatty acid efflux pump transcriptional regulator FarR [Staphylococcus aureus]MBJ6180983.1 fatty acid efflux pump transcriptional regulator FarR [Staphylococcus aureus]MBJ6198554.1 fatty acid efflux pump transcriptional regulator FarR [Staphylococcus aureus]MBJ6202820.1 fatty acid efflux pump transcriptional regula
MKETDLRVIKTKKALSSSLLQLLEQQLFQTITVNQICDNALVHRTTFYKHFYDKYDLLEYLFNQLTKDYFARDISDRLNHTFQTISDTINNKEDLRDIAEFQEEDAEFNKVLKNVCIKIMHNDIKNNRDRIDIDSDIPDNLIFYIYDSLIEGFMHWIKDEKIDWPGEEIDKIFHKVINIKIK